MSHNNPLHFFICNEKWFVFVCFVFCFLFFFFLSGFVSYETEHNINLIFLNYIYLFCQKICVVSNSVQENKSFIDQVLP